MAFSFRNLFKKEEDIQGEQDSTQQRPSDIFGTLGSRTPDSSPRKEDAGGFLDSPFHAADSRFTSANPPALPITVPASQIISLIPQELANPHGVAPEAMVRLPAAGSSGGIKLTEVYQACPTLFAYAPDIRDSREIVLGVHAAAGNPVATHHQTHAAQGQHQPQTQPSSSFFSDSHPNSFPFSSSRPSVEESAPHAPHWSSSSPFETDSLDQRPPSFESVPQFQQPGFESGALPPRRPQQYPIPSDSAPSQQQALFDPPTGGLHAGIPSIRPVTQELDATALPFAPAPPIEVPDELGDIELSLLNLLRGVSQEDLGFDPEEVPPDVRTTLPIALIRPQLSSGKVTVPLSEIVAGCDERFHPAFYHSREGVVVPLPLQEIFHNLPGSDPEGPSAAELVARHQAEGAPIYDPYASPETGDPEPDTTHTAGANFGSAPASSPDSPATFVEHPVPHEETSKPGSSGTQSSPPYFTAEKQPAAVPHMDHFSGGGLSSIQLLGSPFEPVHSPPTQSDPAPADAFPPFPGTHRATPFEPAPSAKSPAHVPSTDFAAFDQQTDLEQLALRAIFQVEGRLTAQGILDLCCGLTGVAACVALHPGGALAAGESESGFGNDAAGMFENVAGLARGLGIGEADTFTIRTRKGTFSFFSQGDLCLGVLHDPEHPAFGPGTREKLVLVTRELGAMFQA